MLTAYQIDVLRSHAEQLLDPVTDFLIEDIARRIAEAGQLTGTASYQVWRAQKLGISQRKLKKEIEKRLKTSEEEVERLLTQAAETGYRFDLDRFPTTHAIPLSANSSLQQILDATVQQAVEELVNMTQTIGFVGPDGACRDLTKAYHHACDFAFQKVTTGAQDYISAVRDATKNLAKKGVRTIDYESGVHTSMEAAVRRNIMGGLGLMQEQISQKNHDSLGCDGWEISAHAASAPDHEPIQGKQYADAEYTKLNNSLVRRIGTLNCGHAAFPIILGVNSPQYTPAELEKFRKDNEAGVDFDGKHYTLYEATQRQRKFERAIRAKKREILVDETLGDKDKLQTNQIKMVRLKQEYKRFSEGVGLPMQHERMETAGFDWKKGKAAEKTVKAYDDVAKMAHPELSGNDWSHASPRVVSQNERAEIVQYAAERGIKIPGLKKFDGESSLLKAEIDALYEISQDLPSGKNLILSVSSSLPDDEFASTTGAHITLNAKALRNREVTERNLTEGNYFAASKLEDIIIHEYGHVFSSVYGNKGIEIARKARYNISGIDSTLDEILAYLDDNVSGYASVFPTDGKNHSMFDLKKYKEVIPEVIVRHKHSPDDFTTEFIHLLKELI